MRLGFEIIGYLTVVHAIASEVLSIAWYWFFWVDLDAGDLVRLTCYFSNNFGLMHVSQDIVFPTDWQIQFFMWLVLVSKCPNNSAHTCHIWLVGTFTHFNFLPQLLWPWELSLNGFVGLYFSTSHFFWSDKSLLPTFLSSLVMHNTGECSSDFPRCPFPQFTAVSFVSSLWSSSVIHWLSKSNWSDGFIILYCRPVFPVKVLVIWGAGSISVLGRVFAFQVTILSVWFTGSFLGADKSKLQEHFLQL